MIQSTLNKNNNLKVGSVRYCTDYDFANTVIQLSVWAETDYVYAKSTFDNIGEALDMLEQSHFTLISTLNFKL